MALPLHIAVIADDLTGAADTGVQFCPVIGPVHLTAARDGQLHLAGMRTGGLAISTGSRHAEAITAGENMRRAWAKVRPLAPARIYKKIDSCLRGNLGAEIDALLQETGATASFVAPALPLQGRITENDMHLVHGVPVSETEIGRDPRCPVRESRLSVLLSGQSRMRVGHVHLSCLEKGLPAMGERVRTLLGRGVRHIVFDAVNSRHLDAVVSLAEKDFSDKKIVLVGSAGLAESLARLMAQQSALPPATARPRVNSWLFVCGSTSRIMAKQIRYLVHKTNWHHLILDPLVLAAGDAESRCHLLDRERGGQHFGRGQILSLQPQNSHAEPGQDPEMIIGGMAKVALSLMAANTPQGLFLSGGDTAEAVLSAIGATGLLLLEQILPGLMRGEVIGGIFNGLPLVTKAGAFGTVDTLFTLINFLK